MQVLQKIFLYYFLLEKYGIDHFIHHIMLLWNTESHQNKYVNAHWIKKDNISHSFQ